MERGEVWWADLAPPAGRRPVLILTRSAAVSARNQLTVALITSTTWHLRSEVPLTHVLDGVSRACVVNCDTLQTVRKVHLENYITTLTPARMAEVHAALKFALELP